MIVNKPYILAFASPDEGAWIEDTLRYGTFVNGIEEKGDWVRGEKGWIKKADLGPYIAPIAPNATVYYRGAYFFSEPDTVKGPILELPFETEVEVVEHLPEQHCRWCKVKLFDGQTGFMQRSQLILEPKILEWQELVEFAKNFLGLKYFWGGTTSFGYDCSGFVQMLYRQKGILLPRNSYQQAIDPRLKVVQDRKACDLVFFTNEQGNVIHVGMLLNQEEFIHAFTKEQAWVCIGSLSDERLKNGHFYFGMEIKRFSDIQ